MAGLLDFLSTPQGMGLLSAVAGGMAGARRGQPINSIGRGLAAGAMGYTQSLEDQRRQQAVSVADQYRQMQMDQMRQTMEQQKAQQGWRANLSSVMAPKLTGTTEQGRQLAEQNAEFGAEGVEPLAASAMYAGQNAPLGVQYGMDKQAVQDYMMRPESPYADKIIERELFPEKVKPVALGKTLVNPETGETIAVDSTWKDDQIAQREQRTQELEMRLEDQRLSREQAAALRRELAANNDALRRDLISVRRDSMAQGNKPPTGYRFTPEGSLEAIPGGPADIKAGEAGEKDRARRDFTLAQSQNVLDAITDAKKLVGVTTTGFGGTLKNIPMTGARNLDAKITTIKANLGFDRLQQMRDTSPTGGALGQVAVQELTALQATVASLDQLQSPAELKKALDKIETHYTNWQSTLKGDQPNKPPASKSAAFNEYLEAYGKAKTPEQRKAITDRARKLGVVK